MKDLLLFSILNQKERNAYCKKKTKKPQRFSAETVGLLIDKLIKKQSCKSFIKQKFNDLTGSSC